MKTFNIEKGTFREFWASLTASQRDELSIALSKKCNVVISTISCWGWGIRTPKSQSQEIIVRHLKEPRGLETDCKTLFPK